MQHQQRELVVVEVELEVQGQQILQEEQVAVDLVEQWVQVVLLKQVQMEQPILVVVGEVYLVLVALVKMHQEVLAVAES